MRFSKKVLGTVGYMGGVLAVPEPFCWSLAQLVQFTNEYVCGPGEIVHLARSRVSFHSHARAELVQQARGDWLLMLDTDHQFEPDLLARLLRAMDAHDAQVVVGLYRDRAEPHAPVLYRRHPSGLFCQVGDFDPPDQPLWVDSAGAGCLLCRRAVFARIEAELGERPFDQTGALSEDHSFFKRLAQLDVPVLCDPRIECHHLYQKPVTAADFDPDAVYLIDPGAAPA